MRTTTETDRVRVKLTLAQAEQVQWALDAMADFWCSETGAHERGGEVHSESDLPLLGPCQGARGPQKTARILALSTADEINSDLLYRLEVQLQDMADGESDGEAGRAARAAVNACLRIRHASPALRKLPRGGGWV
jgi:hypothetical protein